MEDKIIDPKTELTITVTAYEYNQIFLAVQELPHRIAEPILAKIKAQIIEQVKK